MESFEDEPTRVFIPVLFKQEPCVPIAHTKVGIRVGAHHRPRRLDLFRQLSHGPCFEACIEAFETGARVRLVLGGYYESLLLVW